MGCDIHAHLEVKVDGQWHHHSAPRIGRNYALFEKMAGVRGDVAEALAPPRGMPDDITAITRVEAQHYGWDGHSHSWLTWEELRLLSSWYDAQPYIQRRPSFEPDQLGTWNLGLACPDEVREWVEDARLVFWFDN